MVDAAYQDSEFEGVDERAHDMVCTLLIASRPQMKLLKRIVCVIILAATVKAVHATPIHFAYGFTATGLGGPVSTVTGKFGGWYDPAIPSWPYHVGAMTWIDINFAGATFSTANAAGASFPISGGVGFQLGGVTGPDDGVQLFWPNRYDFFLVVYDPGPSAFNRFLYSIPGGDINGYETYTVSLTPIAVPDAGVTGILELIAVGSLVMARGAVRRFRQR